MKRNSLTIIVGSILIVIFGLLLFTFQVRETEVAVVTTFDKPTRFIPTPGLKLKWPRPIQKVTIFDKRIQNFEDDLDQTMTQDGYSLLVMVYAGWTIKDPQKFFNSFPSGTAEAARRPLEGLIRTAKLQVIGRRAFSEFISINPKEVKLAEIEKEILQAVQPQALNYGIEIHFLGIEKLGLPPNVTQKVFDRMQAERQKEVVRLTAEGDATASRIRNDAETKRTEILAKAESEATAIRGQADAEAKKFYTVLNQNPELATLLESLKALEDFLKNTRSELILDERTPPLQYLTKMPRIAGPTNQAAPSEFHAPTKTQ